MLVELHNLPVGVVGVSAEGQVTKDDYTDRVQPMLEAARRDGTRLRIL